MLICLGGVVVNNSLHRFSKFLRLMLFKSFTAVTIRYCSRDWTRFCRCYHVQPILIAVAQFYNPISEVYLSPREWNVVANRFLNKVSGYSRRFARAGVLLATLFWLSSLRLSFFRLPVFNIRPDVEACTEGSPEPLPSVLTVTLFLRHKSSRKVRL